MTVTTFSRIRTPLMALLIGLLFIMLLLWKTQSVAADAVMIDTFPYAESFENGDGGWTIGQEANSPNSWELGVPAGSVINSAADGNNAWVTNLTGSYTNTERSYVVSPSFDFSDFPNPGIKLKIWYATEGRFDGANVQSSTDGGATWTDVDNSTLSVGWYNGGASGLSYTGNTAGWTGSSNGWITAVHPLSSLGGQPDVKLRIAFGSDGSATDDGFAFDLVEIKEFVPLDCNGYGEGEIEPFSSTTFDFTCSEPATVYFGVCDNGSSGADDIMQIIFDGEVVASNSADDGNELISFGSATVDTAGTYIATVESISDGDGPATYAYMTSTDLQIMQDVLSNECGADIQIVSPPNAFTFIDQFDVPTDTVQTSNQISVSGLDAAANISINHGEYSVNGATYTSTMGMVNNGDSVTVRHTASITPSTRVDSRLTIGGLSDTFSSTTVSDIAGSPDSGALQIAAFTYQAAPGANNPNGNLDGFIQIKNVGAEPVSLNGYKVGDEEMQGGDEGMFTLPDVLLAAGGSVVIAEDADTFAFGTPDYSFADNSAGVPTLTAYTTWGTGAVDLDDSSDEVLLIDGSDQFVDGACYGVGDESCVVTTTSRATNRILDDGRLTDDAPAVAGYARHTATDTNRQADWAVNATAVGLGGVSAESPPLSLIPYLATYLLICTVIIVRRKKWS